MGLENKGEMGRVPKAKIQRGRERERGRECLARFRVNSNDSISILTRIEV